MGKKNSGSEAAKGETDSKLPEEMAEYPESAPAPEDLYADASLEEVFDCLEETLSKMDSPDIPLEEAFSLYEQGMKMVAAADGKLKKVEQKLTVINRQADAAEE